MARQEPEPKQKHVLQDFDDLKKAIVEEQKKKSPDIVEKSESALVRYVIDPMFLPREQIDLIAFSHRLRELFGLRLDTSGIRKIIQGRGAGVGEDDLARLIQEQKFDFDFEYGMLHIPHPERATPISRLTISREAIAASVIGSTPEAEWVAQRAAEELWKTAGAPKKWAEVAPHIQLVKYITTTNCRFGVDLLDIFSERFKTFIGSSIEAPESLGCYMGTHPLPDAEIKCPKGDLSVVCRPRTVEFLVMVFDRVSGRQETCQLEFDVKTISELGRQAIRIRSDLDSDRHSQLVHSLQLALKE